MAIVERDIALKHFLVGIGKAPVFAFLIAVIGCLEGFKVSGSAQSVGEHTTSSVVQSIFMVILLDSVAALFFMEMGRSEEHTSELQSRPHLVCRLLLEKKKIIINRYGY